MPKRRCLAAGPKGEGGHAEGQDRLRVGATPHPPRWWAQTPPRPALGIFTPGYRGTCLPGPAPPTVGLPRGPDHGRRVPGHLPCACLLPLESQWPALALAQAPLEQGQPPPTDPDLFTAGEGAVCRLHQTMLSLGQRLLLPSAWGLSGAGGGLPLAVGGPAARQEGPRLPRLPSGARRAAPQTRDSQSQGAVCRCRGKLA